VKAGEEVAAGKGADKGKLTRGEGDWIECLTDSRWIEELRWRRRTAMTDANPNIMITEIAFTGTPVTDMKRAREFYEGVLGLKLAMESAGGMWVEYEVGGVTLGLGCYGAGWKPASDGTCVAFEVDDLDAEIARLKSRGVKVTMEAMDTPVCRFAIISDPDGNKILIHKRKS
jgi:predicted enzyme related to lactoylglutathione lyase